MASRAYEGSFLDSLKGAGQALADWGYQAQQTIGIIPKPSTAVNPKTGIPDNVTKNLTDRGATVVVPNPAHPSSGPLLNASAIVDPSIPNTEKNPASNCPNCGGDTWNPANWSCQAQKALCELGAGASKGFGGLGDFGQYMPYILVGGAAILLIVLLKR